MELFDDVVGADRDLPAQFAVIMAAWERRFARLLTQAAQRRDESIFERRLVDADLFDSQSGGAHSLFQDALRFRRIAGNNIEAVAEALYVDDIFILFIRSADL